MNPWDNLVRAVSLAWPAYLAGFAIYVLIELWIHHSPHRPYDANDDFTDERYLDGFYLQREKRE